ncbi:MAG: Hsp70 family protein [Candidatus Wallbacteria bacterium]|nr:Hsp70 family protein [Candidatus Wallbacteria bacterium]
MNPSRFVVGIDLGTTNTALAYLDTAVGNPAEQRVQFFEVPQLTESGQVQSCSLLPSFPYLPSEHELPEGALALPWDDERDFALGEFARQHGAHVPHRLVSSAKSWLCNPDVDRRSPILPWNAEDDVPRLSPLEVSSRILAHLKEAWDAQMASEDGGLRLENQDVMLTVPASFDAVARELTVEAARLAGLQHVTLLEEPQAALYSWLQANPDGWREQVAVGERILVCDIGGGTTDFCLISVSEEEGNLSLTRVAVGEHLLLGGDNMDLALAYSLERKLEDDGKSIDAWQFSVLVHQARQAKEHLLESPEAGDASVTIPGRGSSLVGGTIKVKLTRDELEGIVLNGFLPDCEAGDRPKDAPDIGLRELGLPYVPDAAVSKYMAKFLGDHRGASGDDDDSEFLRPSAVLYNGGVLKGAALRDRITGILNSWIESSGGRPVKELPNPEPSLAVALGAAYYGAARRGRGVRIRGGTARAYYIGVETARPAVPGMPTPVKGHCVVPLGMEEGTEAQLADKEFGLLVGQSTRFRFFASTTRREDQVGTVVARPERDLSEIDPMEASLPASTGGPASLPVRLHSKVTEVGTLELWFVPREGDQRWKLEFNVRERPAAKAEAEAQAGPVEKPAKSRSKRGA